MEHVAWTRGEDVEIHHIIICGHFLNLFPLMWDRTSCPGGVLPRQGSIDQFLKGSKTHPSAVRPLTPEVMWCTVREFINSRVVSGTLRGSGEAEVRGCSHLWPGRPSLSSWHNRMFPSVLINLSLLMKLFPPFFPPFFSQGRCELYHFIGLLKL